jgi:hypothetical protein
VLGHDSKRRKISSDVIAVQSPAMSSSRKKTPITYGKSKTIFNTPKLEQQLDASESRQTVTTVEKAWDLQGTMREEWYVKPLYFLASPVMLSLDHHRDTNRVSKHWYFSATASLTFYLCRHHHEPMGLFSEPSSTIPNATATQLQLLGEVMAPAFLGNEADPDAPLYEPAKSSVAWSEFLKSSARNTQDHSYLPVQTDTPSDPQQSCHSQRASGVLPLEPTPPLAQTPQLSQTNQQASVPLKGSPLGTGLLQSYVDTKESMGPPLVADQETLVELGPDGSPLSSRATGRSSESQPVAEKSQLSPPLPQKSQEEPLVESTLAAKAKHKSMVPNSEDDLMAIGLPKEEYKPRPSRSRSLKITAAEPIDYSVRPEKAARKPRRSRTTGGEHVSPTSTPEKIQQICDMGFTPATTQKALRENDGDVASTVDWLVVNVETGDELAPARMSRSRSKIKPKIKQDTPHEIDTPNDDTSTFQRQDKADSSSRSAEADAATGIDDENSRIEAVEDQPIVHPTKSPKVSVVIPKSKSKNTTPNIDLTATVAAASPKHKILEGPSKKAKRRKTTMDLPELPLEDPDAIAIEIEIPVEKRRGRGRPRKEPKSTESIPVEQQDDLKADTAATSSTVLQELEKQPNACTTNAMVDADTAGATSTPPLQTTVALASKTPPSQSPEKASGAAPGTSLSLNKGKAPYRVGLSKRARIAPLLRTLKK